MKRSRLKDDIKKRGIKEKAPIAENSQTKCNEGTYREILLKNASTAPALKRRRLMTLIGGVRKLRRGDKEPMPGGGREEIVRRKRSFHESN